MALALALAAASFSCLAQVPTPPAAVQPAVSTPAPAAGGLPASPASAAKVLVGVPGNVFAKLDHGRPTGILLEALDRLLAQAGFRPAYVAMPAGEMPKALDGGQIDIAAVRILSARNKGEALFSDPLVDEYNVPVVRVGEAFPARRAADLKGKVIAGRAGFHYPLIENVPGVTLLRFDSDGAMIRALLLNKVDVAIFAALSDIFIFRTEGVMRRIEMLNAAIGKVPLRAAFSSQRFRQDEVDAFNRAWAAFRTGPEWQQILERNGFADLVREWPLLEE